MADKHSTEIGNDSLSLQCPQLNAPLSKQHPRVFLDIRQTGSAVCPYCGTHYVFRGKRLQNSH